MSAGSSPERIINNPGGRSRAAVLTEFLHSKRSVFPQIEIPGMILADATPQAHTLKVVELPDKRLPSSIAARIEKRSIEQTL